MSKEFLQETNFEVDPDSPPHEEWYIDPRGVKRLKATNAIYDEQDIEMVAKKGYN
tara:strand:- start:3896 stop:4060 length:165 start_codon:yes stop_codon:yes gene_type:complete